MRNILYNKLCYLDNFTKLVVIKNLNKHKNQTDGAKSLFPFHRLVLERRS